MMHPKKAFSLIIFTALLTSCINLYVPSDDSEEDINRFYMMYTFHAPATESVYLIDPRPIFKNMVYRYDLSSQVWTAVASRVQIPVANHYDDLEIFSAKLVNDDRIAILTKPTYSWHVGKAYEIDLKGRDMNSYLLSWPVISNPVYNSNPNTPVISSVVQNQIGGKMYYVADTVLYNLDDNYQFVKKCNVPVGNKEIYKPWFEMLDADTLISLISEYPKNEEYPWIDRDTVTNKKLVICKTNIHTGKKVTFRHPFIDSLNVSYAYLKNFGKGKIVSISLAGSLQGEPQQTLIIKEYNFITNKTRILPSFDFNIAPNPSNVTKWIDITYSTLPNIICFMSGDSIYLFVNESGFVLPPNGITWQPLPVPDFIKLNPKQQ